MSKTLNLTNTLVAQPSLAVSAIGLTAVLIAVSDGLGGSVELRVPRSQAKNIANALNGTVNTQVRTELENGEAARTLTEAQTKRLAKIRATAERTATMNAERSAAAAARKAGKAPAKLKAVG